LASAFLILLSLTLIVRPNDKMANTPLNDDSYYALSVSKNLAEGKGITFDGKTQTNGFQPLFTFLSALVFFLARGDRYLALRFLFILHSIFFVLTAFLLGLIVRDALRERDSIFQSKAFWMTFCLYMSAISILLTHFNGLETGFYLFCLTLTWRYYQRMDILKMRSLAGLGVLLGLCVLARIDSVLLVIILSLSFLIVPDLKWNNRFKPAFITSALAFLVSSPWWLYNWLGFHSIMPSSAKAQQAWLFSGKRIFDALTAIGRDLLPHFYSGHYAWSLMNAFRVGVCVILGIVLLWLIMNKRKRSLFGQKLIGRSSMADRFAACLAIFLLALIAWYTVSSWATHNYGRYFSGLFLLSVPALAVFVLWVLSKRRYFLYIVCVIMVAPIVLAMAMLHSGKGFSGNLLYKEQLALVAENIKPDVVVSAGQSGTLGFFRDKVVNLDGKVNAEALSYQNQIWDYLKRLRISWFCDSEIYLRKYFGNDPEEKGWTFVAKKGSCVLYHYQGIITEQP